ncbi:winged helix-turn-helix domain-containing protein [Kluyvera sichuanensis]|uniref:winged helix-turn-helix domain-containing protein n=1 Tax=Kluyvera sichuanensis TaxID=2725494 RepID=UPI0039F50C3E
MNPPRAPLWHGNNTMLWIINGNIEFNPERNRLASLSRPELSVILTTPASRCLRLLLESAPAVVAQQTFFQKVWEEDGMVVPANTLYQNISIIRRGLRSVGETEAALITTVPRKGFQIEPGVDVLTISKASVQEVEKKALPPADIPPRRVKSKVAISWMLASLFISIGLGYTTWPSVPDKNFYERYSLVETVQGCHFFSRNEDAVSGSRFESDKTRILNTGINCQKHPWIYFPSGSHIPALAVLVCQQPYKTRGDTGCVTLFFRGVRHE